MTNERTLRKCRPQRHVRNAILNNCHVKRSIGRQVKEHAALLLPSVSLTFLLSIPFVTVSVILGFWALLRQFHSPAINIWFAQHWDHLCNMGVRESKGLFTHSMPCPCRAHAVPLPCRATKGLECVFPIWFTPTAMRNLQENYKQP